MSPCQVAGGTNAHKRYCLFRSDVVTLSFSPSLACRFADVLQHLGRTVGHVGKRSDVTLHAANQLWHNSDKQVRRLWAINWMDGGMIFFFFQFALS